MTTLPNVKEPILTKPLYKAIKDAISKIIVNKMFGGGEESFWINIQITWPIKINSIELKTFIISCNGLLVIICPLLCMCNNRRMILSINKYCMIFDVFAIKNTYKSSEKKKTGKNHIETIPFIESNETNFSAIIGFSPLMNDNPPRKKIYSEPKTK